MTDPNREKRLPAGTVGFDNPLNVLGLPGDASGQDLHMATQRLRMELRLGSASDADSRRLERVEQASAILTDPLSRFCASIFWLSADSSDYQSWAGREHARDLSLSSSEVPSADLLLKPLGQSISTRAHNQAIIHCAIALRSQNQGDLEAAAREWTKGLSCWCTVLDSSEWRLRLRMRGKALDDPRLTPEVIEKEIDQIPAHLLGVIGQGAAAELTGGTIQSAEALVRIMRNSPFSSEVKDEVLSEVYAPLTKEIRASLRSIEAELEQVRDRGVSPGAGADIRKLVRRFESEVEPSLDKIMRLGDLPGMAEEHARDQASELLNTLSILAWNLADDGDLAKETLNKSKRYVSTGSLKTQVLQNISEIKNLEASREDQRKWDEAWPSIQSALRQDNFSLALSLLDKIHGQVVATEVKAEIQKIQAQVRALKATYRGIKRQQASEATAGCFGQILLYVLLSLLFAGCASIFG